MSDLILLVADKNMQFALRGALSRPLALGIRAIDFSFLVHPNRDGGSRTDGPSLLALEHNRFAHALLVLDYEGSGSHYDAATLESELDTRLQKTWGDAAKAIVIEPEMDVWMWGSDFALQQVIGHPQDAGIRDWLREQGFGFTETNKPERPKEAMEKLLQELRHPRSSATYERIACAISLRSCTDPAFQRLRQTLQRWFPS